MPDWLPSWLQVILGVVALPFTILSARSKPQREPGLTVRMTQWDAWGVKRTSVEITDTRQL